MKHGDVLKLLNISSGTLSNYSRQYQQFFSPGMKSSPRQYNQNDLIVLATIRELSIEKRRNLDEITEMLESGYRVELEDIEVFTQKPLVDGNLAEKALVISQLQQDLSSVKRERDYLLDRVNKLEDMSEEQQRKIDELNEIIRSLYERLLNNAD
jgi:DNA-binding transcriptional MerR regulator